MYIHWRETESYVTTGRALIAELTRSERRDGKVCRVTVKQLASIQMSCREPNPSEHAFWSAPGPRRGGQYNYHTNARMRFWLRALGHLGALCHDKAGEPDWPTINHLVDLLARRVPLPLPEETEWFAHYYGVEGALEDQERLDRARAAIAFTKRLGDLPDEGDFMLDQYADRIFPALAMRVREARGLLLLRQLPAYRAQPDSAAEATV